MNVVDGSSSSSKSVTATVSTNADLVGLVLSVKFTYTVWHSSTGTYSFTVTKEFSCNSLVNGLLKLTFDVVTNIKNLYTCKIDSISITTNPRPGDNVTIHAGASVTGFSSYQSGSSSASEGNDYYFQNISQPSYKKIQITLSQISKGGVPDSFPRSFEFELGLSNRKVYHKNINFTQGNTDGVVILFDIDENLGLDASMSYLRYIGSNFNLYNNPRREKRFIYGDYIF